MQIARRSSRQPVHDNISVVDVMTTQVIGFLADLSESGMMLLSHADLRKDALYQLRFYLNGHDTGTPINVGVHLLWQGQANASGQRQSGFRFLTISDEQRDQIRRWVETQE
ncbi:MAG: PilZ domain-containing protein [Xanthomonadaceae bacterium]|jgi:c-di-GMP-binding flagellar brake protein YcgR|nr:PilZ domain-containing protein [Xanthomonadaceae bacterium]